MKALVKFPGRVQPIWEAGVGYWFNGLTSAPTQYQIYKYCDRDDSTNDSDFFDKAPSLLCFNLLLISLGQICSTGVPGILIHVNCLR